jgi:carbamoyltransferase
MRERNRIVLGIHVGHDSGAALIQNGKILAAISEERIRNIKHYSGTPTKSILEVLKIAQIHPSLITTVAIAGLKTQIHKSTQFSNLLLSDAFLDWSSLNSNSEGLKHFVSHNFHLNILKEIKKTVKNSGIDIKEIIFVDHHLAHAASAYYLSPWNFDEEVLVFTADGAGDGISSTISTAHKGEINRVKNSVSTYYDSVGLILYSNITTFLGMDGDFDHYKVMGLAPYGKSEKCINIIKNMIDVDKTNPLKFTNLIGPHGIPSQVTLRRILSDHRFDNIAAACQTWFEKLITDWIRAGIKKTGIRKIACAGGDFMNVKTNKLILEMDEVDELFVCPASGDEGLAVGAALQADFELSLQEGQISSKTPLNDLYFGTSFSNEQIEKTLKENDLLNEAQFIDDIDSEVGELLSKEDNIIARFSDQMEWGPRGLGNRSILANASNLEITRKLNHAIKMRDFWMPFGPSILQDRLDDYLVNGKYSPHMIIAFDTTDKRKDITAAIHPFDLTCRPQTVSSKENLGYTNVLKSFESKTGIGGILNTSFNLHGFPIVFNPETAISTFKNSALDYLALGNYLLKKKK